MEFRHGTLLVFVICYIFLVGFVGFMCVSVHLDALYILFCFGDGRGGGRSIFLSFHKKVHFVFSLFDSDNFFSWSRTVKTLLPLDFIFMHNFRLKVFQQFHFYWVVFIPFGRKMLLFLWRRKKMRRRRRKCESAKPFSSR